MDKPVPEAAGGLPELDLHHLDEFEQRLRDKAHDIADLLGEWFNIVKEGGDYVDSCAPLEGIASGTDVDPRGLVIFRFQNRASADLRAILREAGLRI